MNTSTSADVQPEGLVLYQRHEPGAERLSEAAQHWLRSGERGTSSESMLAIALDFNGLIPAWHRSVPVDADDFRRCRLLVEAVPEVRPGFDKIAIASPTFGAILARWDELCQMQDQETPTWRERGARPDKVGALLREIRTNVVRDYPAFAESAFMFEGGDKDDDVALYGDGTSAVDAPRSARSGGF